MSKVVGASSSSPRGGRMSETIGESRHSRGPPIHALPFTSRELSEEEIEAQVEAYGVAAKLVRESGLDGVDLHGTHGALISEFLSPVMNHRKDRWGGSLENRMRFLEEVIRRIREYVGEEIAV